MFDAITVLAGADRPGFMLGGRGAGGPGRRGFGRGSVAATAENARDLTDQAIKDLSALPNVRAVYPSLRVGVEVKFGGDSEFAAAAGIPMAVRGEGAGQSNPKPPA
jgi:hypothetical protein